MSVLSTVAKGAAKILTKKVTTVDAAGDEVTKTKAREGVKGLGWIIGFIICWHFLIQPVLAYHFPDYQFPVLDFGWVTGLLMEFWP